MGRKNITTRLKRQHKTRKELAAASGYSLQYVYSTLNGKDRLPKSTEAKYDEVLTEWENGGKNGKKEQGI